MNYLLPVLAIMSVFAWLFVCYRQINAKEDITFATAMVQIWIAVTLIILAIIS